MTPDEQITHLQAELTQIKEALGLAAGGIGLSVPEHIHKLTNELDQLRQHVRTVNMDGLAFRYLTEEYLDPQPLDTRRVLMDVPAGTSTNATELLAKLVSAEKQLGHARTENRRLSRYYTIVSDLDRCPHGRHEGDTCAGHRGPGLYEGGCVGGISLGNPTLPPGTIIGIDYSGSRFIVVPANPILRVGVDADAWYTPRPPDEELWHYSVNPSEFANTLAMIEVAEREGNDPKRFRLIITALHYALCLGIPAGADCADHGERINVFIELPTGQVAWDIYDHPIEWDGHSTLDRTQRINDFITRTFEKEAGKAT